MSYAYTKLTATGNAKATPGIVESVILTGGSDAATAIVYDDNDGTANYIAKLCAAANTTVQVDLHVACSTGIRVALTGTSPVCTVTYR